MLEARLKGSTWGDGKEENVDWEPSLVNINLLPNSFHNSF